MNFIRYTYARTFIYENQNLTEKVRHVAQQDSSVPVRLSDLLQTAGSRSDGQEKYLQIPVDFGLRIDSN